ncbi:MAG: hypothetical protein GPI92_05995 [Microcystis aeruginosa K13-06]|nr:hypothetical protein [Microcystis aeruginosa K13-06]
MLLKLLSDYLNQVEQAIVQCENAYVERYQEEILTSQRANLRIRLRFKQTHLLEINEAIVITDNYLEFLDYRYHLQDEKTNLVFRYDNTPHFPNLSTFTHHKHFPNDVISCQKHEITQVLKEATELLR